MSLIDLQRTSFPRASVGSVQSPEAWYVVQTKPRQESRARENLERQGFCCLLPTLRVEKVRRGNRLWVDEPLFSRYLFVELGRADARWSVLRSTRGVSQLLRFGGVPAKVPASWMAEFRTSERAPIRLFEPGQRVLVTGGPFSGLEGVYQMPDGEARAMVLLELLGNPCKATFRVEALRRVA